MADKSSSTELVLNQRIVEFDHLESYLSGTLCRINVCRQSKIGLSNLSSDHNRWTSGVSNGWDMILQQAKSDLAPTLEDEGPDR